MSEAKQPPAEVGSELIKRRFWHVPEIEESLLPCDIEVTKAHVRMLGQTGIVDKAAVDKLLAGLDKVGQELSEGKNYLLPSDPDIHAGLERRLRELVGDIAGVVHIAISRNDQIATDIRLW